MSFIYLCELKKKAGRWVAFLGGIWYGHSHLRELLYLYLNYLDQETKLRV